MKFSYLRLFDLLLCYLVLVWLTHASYAAGEDSRMTPIVRAVERVKGSVVNVSTSERVRERANPFGGLGNDPFFENYFNDFFENQYSQEAIRTHLGSGVIINPDGYILTNWHVIQKASSITIATADDRQYEATVVGADAKSDLAVLRIESHDKFREVSLGDSDSLLIGETVIAIGNPFGLSHSVTTGVVSALHRSIRSEDQIYDDFIQTDASINPGNSGGPLLNINGELIGINTAIYGKAEGIGFAIPINTARRIVDELLQHGEVRSPWLGISIQDLSRAVAEHLGYREDYGVIISDIYPSGPGASSGLKRADIVISIGGQKVKSKLAYKRIIGLYAPDNTLALKVFRQGKVFDCTVKAAEFPIQQVESMLWDVFGIQVADNSRNTAQRYNLQSSSGVVVTEVQKAGQAYKRGLRPGDVILKIQTKPIKDSQDFKKQIIRNIHYDTVVLLVQRGPYGYYVNFEL